MYSLSYSGIEASGLLPLHFLYIKVDMYFEKGGHRYLADLSNWDFHRRKVYLYHLYCCLQLAKGYYSTKEVFKYLLSASLTGSKLPVDNSCKLTRSSCCGLYCQVLVKSDATTPKRYSWRASGRVRHQGSLAMGSLVQFPTSAAQSGGTLVLTEIHLLRMRKAEGFYSSPQVSCFLKNLSSISFRADLNTSVVSFINLLGV